MQAQLEGCKRNREVYTKISRELSVAGYNRTYEQCREKLKKLKTEHKKISDKRKQTGQGRYPEWDYFDAMDNVLGHEPSTQPAVVVDTLEDSQVQDTQDDELQQAEAGATPNLDNSDTTVLYNLCLDESKSRRRKSQHLVKGHLWKYIYKCSRASTHR